jgi:hypothetical protein
MENKMHEVAFTKCIRAIAGAIDGFMPNNPQLTQEMPVVRVPVSKPSIRKAAAKGSDKRFAACAHFLAAASGRYGGKFIAINELLPQDGINNALAEARCTEFVTRHRSTPGYQARAWPH